MKQRICSACDMPLDIVFRTSEIEWSYCEEDGKYYKDRLTNEKVRCGECGEILDNFSKELLTED